ncbi:hypothetical protein Tco_0393511 [Tanacetum coccineum]
MQNPEDSSDPTTAMNTIRLPQAVRIETRSQDIKMQMVDDNVGNQVRHNAVQNPAPAEGNGNGINGNPIRYYHCRGEGHYAINYTVKPRKRDAAYLQQQLQIALKEEVGIQSTQEKFEFMDAADAYEETERVKVNCTSEDTLQQASTSGTQSDNAPVYDSDGSTEVPKDENCYDHDIFNMLTYEDKYTGSPQNGSRSSEAFAILSWQSQGKIVILTVLKYLNTTVSSKLEDENVSLEFQANHDVCVLDYVNNMNSHADNRSANVYIRENQKKHKENAKKSKELGSKGSLASSRPSKPRTCLRWIPTRRILAMCRKLVHPESTEHKSVKNLCSQTKKQHTSIYLNAVL